MAEWRARGGLIVGADDLMPAIMGIVNVTPDSFSDGGRADTPEAALAHAMKLVEQGAALLDIGGESTRPHAEVVPLDEELARVVPVVKLLASRLAIPLSIDTSKAEVARRSIEVGASVINDVTAMRGDPDMAPLVAATGAGVILMHMKGTPRDMQDSPRYDDVVAEVFEFLAERIDWCHAQGISRPQIAVDPGIGFGKSLEHNLLLLRNLDRFATLGCVAVIGTSRKGFLGKITGRDVTARAVASAVSSLLACQRGAQVVRVHDVGAMADALKVWTAVNGTGAER